MYTRNILTFIILLNVYEYIKFYYIMNISILNLVILFCVYINIYNKFYEY